MKPAAIFDLDGTLLPYTSTEQLFIKYLIEKRVISIKQGVHYLVNFLKNIGNLEKMTLENKYYYRGLALEELRLLARQFFVPQLDMLISSDMDQCIKYHRAKGDMLILLSGTPTFLLEVLGKAQGFDIWRGTDLECIKGILTGAISGLHPYGRAKLTILKEMRSKYELDFAECFAYANHHSDSFILQRVGHPIVVNPDKELERIALLNGWIGISAYEMDKQIRIFP